jgi:hypothetical protein
MKEPKDERWRDLGEPHERLRWARMIRWQNGTGSATDAARSIGMEPGTYRTYERGPESSKSTPLDHQSALRFGRKFKVNWIWLLTGEGTPFDNQFSPEVERVIDAMSKLPTQVQKTVADMAEGLIKPRKRTRTDG